MLRPTSEVEDIALRGLLERDGELAHLDHVLAAARDGKGALVVIEGPAGAGKLALLEEAGRRAGAAGMRRA